jgi:hypothetical protein
MQTGEDWRQPKEQMNTNRTEIWPRIYADDTDRRFVLMGVVMGWSFGGFPTDSESCVPPKLFVRFVARFE